MRQYEEEYITNSFIEPKIMNDFNINLRKYTKRKYREKFRQEVNEGLPFENMYLYTHHYSNNKPSVYFILKVDPEKVDQHYTEGIKKYGNYTPRIMSRYEIKMVK